MRNGFFRIFEIIDQHVSNVLAEVLLVAAKDASLAAGKSSSEIVETNFNSRPEPFRCNRRKVMMASAAGQVDIFACEHAILTRSTPQYDWLYFA
jgi:hypothetical protein